MTEAPRSVASAAPVAGRPGEHGIALVLALIFSILLYILVAELVVASRMVRATGENDALLARMNMQMRFQLDEVGDQLLQDMAGAAAAEEGAGGAGGAPGGLGSALAGAAGAAGGGEAPPGEGEPEEDPSSKCDSSRDSWFEPVGNADNDLTTYVWVEDENRKFNLLALWSPDEKFAEFSRDRLVRLLDTLREDSDFDLPSSDAQRIVSEITEWGRRSGTEMMPRPRLKSDDEKKREQSVPMHLDELLLLSSVTEDLFFDKVLDGKVYLGLESVLTLWTSLRADPGDPEKIARQRAAAEARGETPTGGAPAAASGSQPGGGQPAGGAGGAGNAGRGGAPTAGGAGAASGEEPPPQPEGLGLLINVNTASRPVLRSLFPPEKIPDRVIDAIIRWRNEVDQEATEAAAEESGEQASEFGELKLGADTKKQFFETVADLEKVEEFARLPDPEIKTAFQAALTTKSEVFSIHLATMFKRSEENRIYVLRRARATVLRYDDGADGKIIPLIPFEDRSGLRVQPVDMQEENIDLTFLYSEMDQFAQEDRAWNPFLIDFYLPKHQREQFYRPN